MVRSWPGRLARWLIRGYPRRPAAVITTGCLAAALTVAAALAGPGAVEKIFRLPLLGDARQPQVKAFGPDDFTR